MSELLIQKLIKRTLQVESSNDDILGDHILLRSNDDLLILERYDVAELINTLSEWLDNVDTSDIELPIKRVSNCKHENEITRQGDGFTYVICGDCGADL